MKVGQWYREGDNRFYQIKSETHINNLNVFLENGLYKIKVANTPQELIQVGDLVFTSFTLTEVHKNYKDYFIAKGHYKIKHKHITKILTPNGKDYICQWEKTNE